ncbi:DUF305 domain-containing protein [Natronorarus salvus]|uniref:DUF305 domain-containing protein n=1 Tax=Natronorarus salvus TaxID=3117733 RepID=UPI002F2632A0
MTLDTSRRRVLYLIGATGATGSVAAAGSHDDDDGSDRSDDQGDHGEDRDDDEDEDEDRDDRHDGELNEADVRFLQMMIPHHEQATEMAELVLGRTNRSELCALAEEVIEAQEAEMGTMEEWLETHGHDPHDHEMDHDEMDGMLTDEAMDELAAAEGDEFDRLFLSGMIHHHEGAIVMAEDVLAEGEDGDVRQLAEEVIEVQEAEIETMRKWCRDWF